MHKSTQTTFIILLAYICSCFFIFEGWIFLLYKAKLDVKINIENFYNEVSDIISKLITNALI